MGRETRSQVRAQMRTPQQQPGDAIRCQDHWSAAPLQCEWTRLQTLPTGRNRPCAAGRQLKNATDADLAGPAGFHELERGPKQWEILLVVGDIGAIDLYPFPGTGHTAGLKRDNIVPGEL